jgi:hypothetical protein
MAPDLTLARHAATYQAGIPTHSSSQATMVGPFHKANGVPAFIASARSSCLKKVTKNVISEIITLPSNCYIYFFHGTYILQISATYFKWKYVKTNNSIYVLSDK